MLTPGDNAKLTAVGPDTPAGNLFRRYWQPFALSSELPENDGAPIRVRILGEDLVAYRDTNGVAGLVDAFCPHRRAPMFFGRNEELVDRSQEHLGTTDRPIIIMRKLMLEAIDDVAAGKAPRGTDAAAYRNVRALDHLVNKDADWRVALAGEMIAKV